MGHQTLHKRNTRELKGGGGGGAYCFYQLNNLEDQSVSRMIPFHSSFLVRDLYLLVGLQPMKLLHQDFARPEKPYP